MSRYACIHRGAVGAESCCTSPVQNTPTFQFLFFFAEVVLAELHVGGAAPEAAQAEDKFLGKN